MGNTSSSSIALPIDRNAGSKKQAISLSRLIGCGSIVDDRKEDAVSLFEEKIYNVQPQAILPPTYSPPYPVFISELGPMQEEWDWFINAYRQYEKTSRLDGLREKEYTRLKGKEGEKGETYVDYTGGGMYPEYLITEQADFLKKNVIGNTHSVNNSSQLSMEYAKRAREETLKFFGAQEGGYTVVFTPNATGALKLMGEAFPFTLGSSYVLSADSHNSVNGIRQFVIQKGAEVVYIPTTRCGGLVPEVAQDLLERHKPSSRDAHPSLFVLTAQSNATNCKNDFKPLIDYAKKCGYYTMLDVAALVPCSKISLSEVGADAMCVSFYKMFGYPTGLGALVVRETLLTNLLQRPWFGGGTVDLVQAPGRIINSALVPHEQFEDGTINYASTKGIVDGLKFLEIYQPYVSLRISCLMNYMWKRIPEIKHDVNINQPVAKIVSHPPGDPLTEVGQASKTGTIVALLFYCPKGELLPIAFIEYAAQRYNISLRSGCVCNPGGVSAMIGIEKEMADLHWGMTKKQWQDEVLHREPGIVRVSFGLVSNFEDAWTVLHLISDIGKKDVREKLWEDWPRKAEFKKCPSFSFF